MSRQYSAEFKEQGVKRVLAGESSAKVARIIKFPSGISNPISA